MAERAEDITQEVKDERNTSDDIGSKCVVLKNSKLPPLARLDKNVDLNLPPPNWLRQQTRAGYSIPYSLFSHHFTSEGVHPSSITLASHYPDRLRNIDVISDAKNVKKLLMLPYSTGGVSMAVHRVGKTLLLDELTPALIPRGMSSINQLSSEGVHLPKFLTARKKDPDSSRHRNRYSKLLYYSIEDEGGGIPMLPATEEACDDRSALLSNDITKAPILTNDITTAPILTDDITTVPIYSLPPVVSDQQCSTLPCDTSLSIQPTTVLSTPVADDGEWNSLPCPAPEPPPQPFHLNVQWSIQDIQMLLGSDLPIFGRGGQPAISLRLRDMEKPVTVLTGLDYWLDNLMCNVPEIAMCFHLNGIVQKYEVLKTEQIPQVSGCQFSPQEVLQVAQNILAFLKTNCTREGHTYWLFRSKGEDIVKLYDITSLSATAGGSVEKENPFAANVAMLFYRVSKSMLSNGPHSSEDLATIKLLLENCIKLLHEDKESQIVLSSYYLLSDLVLSHTPTTSCTSSSASSFDDDDDDDDVSPYPRTRASSSVTGGFTPSLSVSDLRSCQDSTDSLSHCPPIPPLVLGTQQDRAKTALEYISKGLNNLTSLDCSQTLQWNSTCQLLQKASHAYWILTESAMGLNKFGRALRYLKHCVLCSKTASAMINSIETCFREHEGWKLCGDIHCLTMKASDSLASHLEDYRSINEVDESIMNVVSCIGIYQPSAEEVACLVLHMDLETSLKRSIDCYHSCIKLLSGKPSKGKSLPGVNEKLKMVKERLGNALNELGVLYKQKASAMDFNKESVEVKSFWSHSCLCLNEGLMLFNETSNVQNQALLYANLGSLMRSQAVSYATRVLAKPANDSDQEYNAEFGSQERECYERAVDYYSKGLKVLHKPFVHQDIWYNIECDLASVYYTMGEMMQQRPPLSSLTLRDVERKLVSFFMKAAQQAESALSKSDASSSRYITLSQCIGDSHFRLASFYQKTAFGSDISPQKLKQFCTQSNKHYSKAINHYLADHHQSHILRICVERALLLEQQSSASEKQSVHLLHQSLDSLFDTQSILNKTEDRSFLCMAVILVHRLQAVLKQLLSISVKRKELGTIQQIYKEMYARSLKCMPVNSADLLIVRETLHKISELKSGLPNH